MPTPDRYTSPPQIMELHKPITHDIPQAQLFFEMGPNVNEPSLPSFGNFLFLYIQTRPFFINCFTVHPFSPTILSFTRELVYSILLIITAGFWRSLQPVRRLVHLCHPSHTLLSIAYLLNGEPRCLFFSFFCRPDRREVHRLPAAPPPVTPCIPFRF